METHVLARFEYVAHPVCSGPARTVEANIVGCAGAMISVPLTPPAWAGLWSGGEGTLVAMGPATVSYGQATFCNFSAVPHYSSTHRGHWNKQGKEPDGS